MDISILIGLILVFISSVSCDDSGKAYFTQKLDHFDESNTATWQHRYWYNSHYATPDSNVNFLVLAGEMGSYLMMISGPETTSYVYYASQFNASLYALDQRFYGDSHPTEDTSIDNLKYLSSRQVIEDVAEFIRQKNDEKEGDQKWIVVGGGYAGNLAAWSRMLHPQLIDGAIASSAPIQAKLDFYGYLQTLDADFAKIGGLCYKQISEGLNEAVDLFQSPEGRSKLSSIFQVNPSFSDYDVSENDISLFFAHVISPFIYAAQNNNPTIPQLCDRFTSKGDRYDALLALRDINPYIHITVSFNYTAEIEKLKKTNYGDNVETRLWTYQRCAEYGFIQSSNMGDNVFGETQSSNLFINYCQDLFGISAEEMERNVDATNKEYGGTNYFTGTNVIFTHGTIDPWTSLTKTSDSKHESVVIAEIEGGWHSSDLGTTCDLIPPNCANNNMAQIQSMTMENIARWINPTSPVPDQIEIPDNIGKRPEDFYPLMTILSDLSDVIQGKYRMRAKRMSKKVNIKFRKNRNSFKKKPEKSANVEESFIEQQWDHFNTSDERTFKQRFWMNDEFGGISGSNFLLVGSNELENETDIQNDKLPLVIYAETVGANIYLLEHRYYGESNLGTNDLQYLTSSQMIYDVASFIQMQQVTNNRNGPWIAFGSSYGGSLSAWSREWFPELITGTVASSSPMLLKNNFFEYLHIVEDIIVGQSQLCFDRVEEAFDQLRKDWMDPEGRKRIEDKFNVVPHLDGSEGVSPLDTNTLFFNLYSIFIRIVEDSNGNDVKLLLCDFFEDTTTYTNSVDALRAVQENLFQDHNIETSRSYEEIVEKYSTLVDRIDGSSDSISEQDISELLWLWQTCNEFGFHATTDFGSSIFAVPVPLNFHVTLCERVFNLTMDEIESGIARSLYQYGGRDRFNATNIVFTNGEKDPWKALGITEQMNLNESIVPIIIEGVSHCADMREESPSDSPSLNSARETVLANIQKWTESETSTMEPEKTEKTESTTRRTMGTTTLQSITIPISISSFSTSIDPTTSTTITNSPTTSTSSFNNVIVQVITMLFLCYIM